MFFNSDKKKKKKLQENLSLQKFGKDSLPNNTIIMTNMRQFKQTNGIRSPHSERENVYVILWIRVPSVYLACWICCSFVYIKFEPNWRGPSHLKGIFAYYNDLSTLCH